MERRMSKVQSNLPVTNDAAALAAAVQGDASAPAGNLQREVRGDEGAGPDEHSLLSRPAVPQCRRSLFRR